MARQGSDPEKSFRRQKIKKKPKASDDKKEVTLDYDASP